MPKTGSTFLTSYLVDKYSDLIAVQDHKYLYKDSKKRMLALENNYEFKFCFVRDPLSRFISAYSYILTKKAKIKTYDSIEREALLSYENLHNFCLNLEEFTSNPNNSPVHFYPQYSWITDEHDNLTMDYVGKFESMDDDWKIICHKINIEYEPIFNRHQESWKSKLKKSFKKYVFNRFSFTQEDRDLVRNFYKKDYEIFGY